MKQTASAPSSAHPIDAVDTSKSCASATTAPPTVTVAKRNAQPPSPYRVWSSDR